MRPDNVTLNAADVKLLRQLARIEENADWSNAIEAIAAIEEDEDGNIVVSTKIVMLLFNIFFIITST
jgi:wyosine [tRNA(Phe)-imidazoG37] synthetase (radical SAM superfamily)